MEIAGKVFLVTGAGAGGGQTTMRALAADVSNVVLTDMYR